MFYGNHLPPSGQRVRLRMNYMQHVNYTYIAQLEMKELKTEYEKEPKCVL